MTPGEVRETLRLPVAGATGSLHLPAIFDAAGAALGGSSDARMLLLTGVMFPM